MPFPCRFLPHPLPHHRHRIDLIAPYLPEGHPPSLVLLEPAPEDEEGGEGMGQDGRDGRGGARESDKVGERQDGDQSTAAGGEGGGGQGNDDDDEGEDDGSVVMNNEDGEDSGSDGSVVEVRDPRKLSARRSDIADLLKDSDLRNEEGEEGGGDAEGGGKRGGAGGEEDEDDDEEDESERAAMSFGRQFTKVVKEPSSDFMTSFDRQPTKKGSVLNTTMEKGFTIGLADKDEEPAGFGRQPTGRAGMLLAGKSMEEIWAHVTQATGGEIRDPPVHGDDNEDEMRSKGDGDGGRGKEEGSSRGGVTRGLHLDIGGRRGGGRRGEGEEEEDEEEDEEENKEGEEVGDYGGGHWNSEAVFGREFTLTPAAQTTTAAAAAKKRSMFKEHRAGSVQERAGGHMKGGKGGVQPTAVDGLGAMGGERGTQGIFAPPPPRMGSRGSEGGSGGREGVVMLKDTAPGSQSWMGVRGSESRRMELLHLAEEECEEQLEGEEEENEEEEEEHDEDHEPPLVRTYTVKASDDQLRSLLRSKTSVQGRAGNMRVDDSDEEEDSPGVARALVRSRTAGLGIGEADHVSVHAEVFGSAFKGGGGGGSGEYGKGKGEGKGDGGRFVFPGRAELAASWGLEERGGGGGDSGRGGMGARVKAKAHGEDIWAMAQAKSGVGARGAGLRSGVRMVKSEKKATKEKADGEKKKKKKTKGFE